MRTTIEIGDEQRARLLEAAAKRGEKGFSSIVQEALAQYFEAEKDRKEKARSALEVLGSFSAEEADQLEESVRELRGAWR